jgi:gamma-tubulin complex component 2
MSSSNAKATTQTQRRSTHLNDTPANLKLRSTGSKTEGPDGRLPQSPQPHAGSIGHKKVVSGSQRTTRNVEERRVERTQVTTRETITARTRSPERRSTPVIPSDRPRNGEGGKTNAGDSKSRPYKTEPPQGMVDQHEVLVTDSKQ